MTNVAVLIGARKAKLFRHKEIRLQGGFTLVEILVALAISSIIALAAVAALIVSRQGLTTVDTASQLRDNGRFATDLIQRLGVQTGFKDPDYAMVARNSTATNPDPNVFGFNNATSVNSDPYFSSTPRVSTTVGYGSDILILRYQASATYEQSNVPDGGMVNCNGTPAALVPGDVDDRIVSVLHVEVGSDGEPSLMCTVTPGTAAQPIVKGVENFQVLFGTDNVTPNTAPSGAAITRVANRYLRADELTVPGAPDDTKKNWRRVVSIRIGMVIRGPLGSIQDTTAQTFYPFGLAPGSSGGAAGSALSSTSDVGTIFSPGADTRMRQVVTFTVPLRNYQGL